MTLNLPPTSLLLVCLSAVFAQLSTACPDGFHTFYCGTCPATKCFNFLEEDAIFRQDFTESNSACSGQGTDYGGVGRLLEFRSNCEFERVRLLVAALAPSSPYLTGLRYDSQGNIFDSMAIGAGLSGILNTSLPLTGATENAGRCIAIGLTSASTIDLMPVNCNEPAPSVCGLDTTALPVPTIDGDDRRYVGPNGDITLVCEYSTSTSRTGTTWLLDGEDVRPMLGDGNSIDDSPTSSTLTFTRFDRATHAGSYQCRLMGLLGDLVSKSVEVRPARAPVIQRLPDDLDVYEQGIAFFDCFPNLDTVPHPEVQWSYNGAPLDVSNTTKYQVNNRTARLFISNVTQSDAGEYSCTLSNIEGTVSSTGAGTLTVMATPTGTPSNPNYLAGPGRDTSNIEVLAGSTFTVECVADTFHPNVRYSWTYPNGLGTQAAINLDYPTPVTFGNLMLLNVQVAFSGEFEVQVRLPGLGENNEPLNANSPRTVNVDVQAVPTVTSISASQVVTLGTNATMTCQYDGNPSPALVWYKDGEVVTPSSKYIYSTVSPTEHTLTVINVQPADLTSYQCHPFNTRGSTVGETFLCGQPGVPGPVNATVEPFTRDSVRITWDPPADSNDDIELLEYLVYYEVRSFGQPETFTIDGEAVDEMRAWNERSVLVTSATQQSFILAIVVAVSANGMGAVAAEQSYGITYGNAATVPPENVGAVQVNDQTVRVSWSLIPSDRQPDVQSDITYYEVQYYSIGGAVQVATNVQIGRSTGLTLDIAYQRNNDMVLAARVRGVTQLRREPDNLAEGPWSEVVFSGAVPPPPPSPLPIILGVICPVIFLLLIAFIVVILVLYYYHRRQRGRYFPGKAEMSNVTLDRDLNGTQGWEERKEYHDV